MSAKAGVSVETFTGARLALIAVLVICGALAGFAVDTAHADPGQPIDSCTTHVDDVTIVELYPNPTAHGDAGEYVVVFFPHETALAGWVLTDEHTTAAPSNRSVAGCVAFSVDPDAADQNTDYPVVALDGHLRLANDGDAVTLRRNASVVDRVEYGRAPEGDVWYRSTDGDAWSQPTADGEWWPLGATRNPPVTVGTAETTVFVVPDAPDVAIETLASAEDRILLAGYTFASPAIAEVLRSAEERGVDVRVLVESGPVGGITYAQAAALDDLVAANVSVRVLGGHGARYRYHHAKYAVVDDRALVTTENWKPSGIGGRSNRGWGAVVEDEALADELATVFEADVGGWDTQPWAAFRSTASFVEDDSTVGSYPAEIEAETVAVDRVDLVLAPDNTEDALVDLLRSAEESIAIEQVSVRDRRENPLLWETIEAARRGVEVRILLSDAWYVREENRALVTWLTDLSRAEGLPIEARLVESRSRFDVIHAKGVIVDEESVVVGSVNWNTNALRNNREVAVILHGTEVGSYYTAVFRADWNGGVWRLPAGLIVMIAIGLAGAGLVARRSIDFSAGRVGDRLTRAPSRSRAPRRSPPRPSSRRGRR